MLSLLNLPSVLQSIHFTLLNRLDFCLRWIHYFRFSPAIIAELRAPEARARSPIDKRFWYTHESEKFWLWRHRPTVRRTSAPLCKPHSTCAATRVFSAGSGGWLTSITKQTRILKNTDFLYSLNILSNYICRESRRLISKFKPREWRKNRRNVSCKQTWSDLGE